MIVNKEDIAKAEDVLKKYISEKHSWNDDVYEISIHSKDANSDIVNFMIYHEDDKNPTSLGGGKSFIVKFDMQKKVVVQELYFQ